MNYGCAATMSSESGTVTSAVGQEEGDVVEQGEEYRARGPGEFAVEELEEYEGRMSPQ